MFQTLEYLRSGGCLLKTHLTNQETKGYPESLLYPGIETTLERALNTAQTPLCKQTLSYIPCKNNTAVLKSCNFPMN